MPRRILFLHTTSEVGGSDVSLAHLVERLDRTRFEPFVALPSHGPLVPRLEAAGARVLVVPRMQKLTSRKGRAWLAVFAANYPAGVAALARIIRRERIDLVHTNTIHNLYGWAAAKLTGRPHVWHIREIVWQNAALLKLERHLALRHSTRVVVTSDAVAAAFETNGVRPPHVVKIPNGVDLRRFTPDGDAPVRTDLAIGADAPLVGAAARMDVWKGLDDFIDAAKIVHAARPAARFVIAGGAIIGLEAYEQTLRAKAAANGLDGVLTFAGWTYGPDRMPAFHRSLDVFVLPSREAEPFGLVVLEAMASARPIVATAHGGPLEILTRETGVLTPPRDPQAMANAIIALLDAPGARAAMGVAARARVEARYDIALTVRRIEALYDEVLH